MSRLEKLIAREVLDSRGNPTVEVEAIAANGARGRAIVPSGASTGQHEAVELRDGDPKRLSGKGVRRAVQNVTGEIANAVVGMDLSDQEAIDRRLIALDGTPHKGRLGANAILGTSLAVAYAAAAAHGEELFVHLHRLWRGRLGPDDAPDAGPTLPMPMINMISGGWHAGRQLDIQDVLMIPIGATSYPEALDWAVAVYHALGRVLIARGEEGALVGDEGGYGPKLATNEQALECVVAGIEAAGLRPGTDVSLALDVASTHFFDPGTARYRLSAEGGRELDAQEMVDVLERWVDQYHVISIEDGVSEDDWEGWGLLTKRLGSRLQLIGDDLFCTQTSRLERGIAQRVANAILIKVNQVGTLSETFDTLLLARRNGYRVVISARSGETEDATIADLAVAVASGQIKIGSVARSERLAKYNRLLRLGDALGGAQAPFARGALGLEQLTTLPITGAWVAGGFGSVTRPAQNPGTSE